MLDIAFKEKWVSALRSGKYRQCRRVLRNNHNEYCCLGVAADIVAPADWSDNGNAHVNQAYAGTYEEKDELAGLGLTGEMRSTLVDMNDSLGKDFHEIANFVGTL